jgi:hypothetical protein
MNLIARILPPWYMDGAYEGYALLMDGVKIGTITTPADGPRSYPLRYKGVVAGCEQTARGNSIPKMLEILGPYIRENEAKIREAMKDNWYEWTPESEQ